MIVIAGYFYTSNNSAEEATVPAPVAEQATSSATGSMSTGTSYTLAEVAQHATESDCWLSVEGNVYNATSFISKHPGGADKIISACGTDATEAFASEPKHEGPQAKEALQSLIIGTLQR